LITVMETWFFKSELADRALELMQEEDELVGPNAHDHPGWSGHADFYQRADDPSQVVIVYPWLNRESHADLTAKEEPLLSEFVAKYCRRPRVFEFFTELPVEVEHDHDH